METLNLEQMSYIGEIIGGIGVILSLIYVGVQLKQNTRAIKQESIKNIIETLRDAAANLSQNEDVAEIAFTAMTNPTSLTGKKKFRSYVMLQNLLSAFELAHFQQQEGALEKSQWSGYQQYLIDLCKQPGVKEYWEARSMWYKPDFRLYINEVILPAPASPNYRIAGT